MSSMCKRDFLQRMERNGPGGRKGSHQGVEVYRGHTREKDGTIAEARTSGGRDHAVGTRRRRLGLAQVQGPNTVIIAEVAAGAGSERRGLRKFTEKVEAGLLVHPSFVAETQQWMHKRPWLEDWKEPRNYRSRRRKKVLRSSSSNNRRSLQPWLPLLQLLLQQQLQTLHSMWQPSWPLGHRSHLRLPWQLRWQPFKPKPWQRPVLLCPAIITHLLSTQ